MTLRITLAAALSGALGVLVAATSVLLAPVDGGAAPQAGHTVSVVTVTVTAQPDPVEDPDGAQEDPLSPSPSVGTDQAPPHCHDLGVPAAVGMLRDGERLVLGAKLWRMCRSTPGDPQ